MHFFLASFVSGRVRSRVRGGREGLEGVKVTSVSANHPPPWDEVVLLGKNYQDQFFFFFGRDGAESSFLKAFTFKNSSA